MTKSYERNITVWWHETDYTDVEQNATTKSCYLLTKKRKKREKSVKNIMTGQFHWRRASPSDTLQHTVANIGRQHNKVCHIHASKTKIFPVKPLYAFHI